MKVFAIVMPYEGPEALFASREGAEVALADTEEWPIQYGYYIQEWTLHP